MIHLRLVMRRAIASLQDRPPQRDPAANVAPPVKPPPRRRRFRLLL
jgi:hypothetical protein